MPPLVLRVLTFLLISGLGVGVYFWLHASAEPPRKRGASERGRAVRVLQVKRVEIIPRAIGYGVVRAQREWQGVAQVGGTIVELREDVEVGRVVQEGTPLFRIDPGSLELERSRTEAVVRAVRAQISESLAREANARASLAVERKVLALAQKDRDRVRGLQRQGLASQAQVEQAERDVLNVERSIRNLQNTLSEMPRSRAVLEAQLAQQEVGVEGAELNLARAEVVAPFTMRIRAVNAGLQQTVSAGQVVIAGDGIDVMEVAAQVPVGTIGPLLAPRPGTDLTVDPDPEPIVDERPGRRGERGGRSAGEGRRPRGERGGSAPEPGSAPDPDPDPDPGSDPDPDPGSDPDPDPDPGSDPDPDPDPGSEPEPGSDPGSAPAPAAPADAAPAPRGPSRAASITALVRLKAQGLDVTWEGRFRRFEGTDPATRTSGVVIEVDEPRRRGNGGSGRRGPPLSAGLHVEVELRGAPRGGCLAVPRSAINRDRVLVVGEGNRLVVREITVDLMQEDYACVATGVETGERVVLTPIAPAVEGTLLAPQSDEVAARWLAAAVRGESPAP